MRHLIAILLLLLAGCATAPPSRPVPVELFADAAFAPPSVPVNADDLFALSPEMRAYLHSPGFSATLRAEGKERGLLDALYTKGKLKLEYDAAYTRTAAETFRDRVGNCMSLVIMTAAFAKELGLQVRFQSVDIESWSRGGGLYLLSGHVNIVLGSRRESGDVSPDSSLLVDFLASPHPDRARTHVLEEREIVSMFQNNRAAEAMVAGRLDEAYWWARAAVARDPDAAIPLNSLGVIHERHGDKPMAERAYRAALLREPDNITALRNLGTVLAALGKADEAQAVGRRLASLEPVPPFQYFYEGLDAYRKGDYDKARDRFAREVKRASYNDEFHFWLGVSYLRLGDLREARKELALAVDNSTQDATRQRYSAKLAHLRQLGMR